MRSYIKYYYHQLIFFVDYWVAKLSSRNSREHSVAIIRVDLIGDFILWLPAAEKIRSIFPNAKLTLVANANWADLARELPYWDEVIAVNMRWFSFEKLLYRWKVLQLIASKGFQIAIQPVYSRSLANGDSIVRATHASERIGSIGNLSNLSPKEFDISKGWYTKLYLATDGLMHEIDRNLEIMGQIAGVIYERTLPRLVLADELKPNLIQSSGQYVVIAPGASWEGRRWSISKLIELIQLILEKFKLEIIICGSGEEFELCESIKKQVPCVVNIAGKTTLKEMASILKESTLVIGNESAAIHLANAVGTQSICILGGGHFGRFMPYPQDAEEIKPYPLYKKMDCYQCNWRCTTADIFTDGAPCIQGVEFDQVKTEVERILGDNLSH